MHIGGGVGGQDDNLLHFKIGFSKSHYPFKVWKWIVDQARYDRLCYGRDTALPVANTGHFPCYRCKDDQV
jgi:hypothetical protein